MSYVLGNINKDLLIIILAAIIMGFITHINQNRKKRKKEKNDNT